MFVAHLMLPNPGPQLMELDWKYVKYVSISYVWLHESHVDNTKYSRRDILMDRYKRLKEVWKERNVNKNVNPNT